MNKMFVYVSRNIVLLVFSAMFLYALNISAQDTESRNALPVELKQLELSGGLIVHLGCGDGRLTAALHANTNAVVQGLSSDTDTVNRARDYIQSTGLYGKVSIEKMEGAELPYRDNLVNLLVVSNLAEDFPESELMRVLAPRGILMRQTNDGWQKSTKPVPADIDEWSHYLHAADNNAVAKDKRVAPPNSLQWTSGPRWGRSHEYNTSLSGMVTAGGRIFAIVDESLPGMTDGGIPTDWKLICKDAFNGLRLWERPMESWGEQAWDSGHQWRLPTHLVRRMVATEDRLYITPYYDGILYAVDAATGKTTHEYKSTQHCDEILYSNGKLIVRLNEQVMGWKEKNKKSQIVALDPGADRELWRHETGPMLGLTLCMSDGRVFYHDYEKIRCLDAETGKEKWTARTIEISGRQHFGAGERNCAMAVSDGVVVFLSKHEVVAVDAKDGSVLWQQVDQGGTGHFKWPDLFIINDVVWPLRNTTGFDLRTGEVAATIDPKQTVSGGHHARCYRSKATERYQIWPQQGAEFIDLQGDEHMRYNFLRGTCMYGVLPANGFTYGTPHHCFCYPGVAMKGFNALESFSDERIKAQQQPSDLLVRGPAFGDVQAPDKAAPWPMYRMDVPRSAHNPAFAPSDNAREWKTELNGALTPPVVSSNHVIVARKDAHEVVCLDSDSGDISWRFTAGGRVDSSPTLHKDYVLFGSADGWVYAVRESDGVLAWKFRAAPIDRRIVSYGQVESVWPSHGSVVVLDDLIYCSAGRSSFLDGGIHVYALEYATGDVKHHTVLDGPWPDIERNSGHAFEMDGTASDLLLTDGEYLYMTQVALDKTLKEVRLKDLTHLGDKQTGMRLSATGGLLDDSGFNRIFWMYARRWPGYYFANQAPKAGQILCFDSERTYTVKYFTGRQGLSASYTPGTHGYLLMADANDNEPYLKGYDEGKDPLHWLPGEVRGGKRGFYSSKAADVNKGTGFTRTAMPEWQTLAPVRMQTMVVGDKYLYVAGVPDAVPENDPMASFEGRMGGFLMMFDKASGEKIGDSQTDWSPVFDGMTAADGRLFVSTRQGAVRALNARLDGDKVELKPVVPHAASAKK